MSRDEQDEAVHPRRPSAAAGPVGSEAARVVPADADAEGAHERTAVTTAGSEGGAAPVVEGSGGEGGSAGGGTGYELPMRFLLAFRSVIDEVNADLAEHGHADMRPMHGFVFQAIARAGGPNGCTAADLGRVLGVSKQAAGKHIDTLERLGYLRLSVDPADARRKVCTLTDRAHDALDRSARVFDRVRDRWSRTLGPQRLAALEHDLRVLAPGELFRLDTPQWFNG
ncbi:MarR family winged helix-turn-helix transcriptional regulator [Nocardia higoensis]|nr:helix-turn-helix domain-containing protein [Nocardia higoensis]